MPPVNLFIRSLKDGVGRQAATKRLPTEAQELINTVITVERSAEKRPGTRHVPCKQFNDIDFNVKGELSLPDSSEDMFHYWFDFTPHTVYLISIDYKSAPGSPLIYVHEVTHGGGNPTMRVIEAITPDVDLAAYLRHGNETNEAREALSVIAVGPRLLLLNKKVATGYSSDESGFLFDLDGNVTTDTDVLGQPVTYKTSSAMDPQGTALVWVEGRAYAAGQEVYKPSDGVGGTVYVAKVDVSSSDNTNANYGSGTYWNDTGRDMALIDVKDAKYPDPSKAYLGQSLPDISSLPLPPPADDVRASNGAETMLAALYPDELGAGQNGRTSSDAGKGKVYYFENGYGGSEPGYYIVRSATASPYLMKIRSPEAFSRVDNNRMPIVLIPSDGGNAWDLEAGTYDTRIAGDVDSNPGPTAWKGGTQAPISAMATFRNRLWYAIGDTVFSSETNDYGNFFLADPSLIVDTDPIDVLLSSNKYTPVVSLTPFESYIFVNTGADVQFALEGSENQITPYTAALSSESFYSTSSVTEPLLMGNQVYFFDDRRLYIYMPSSAVSVQRASEVSKHVPSYLPTTYGSMTVCNAYETLFMTDDDSRNDVYCYTNRFQGDQLLQNAFFRMQYSKSIQSMHTHEEEVYLLTRNSAGEYSLYVQRFREDAQDHIWLDDAEILVIEEGVTSAYDESSNTTTLTFANTADSDNDIIITGYEATAQGFVTVETQGGVLLTVRNIDRSVPGEVRVDISGRLTEGQTIYFGKNYEMRIILSPVFQRDQSNNVVDGLLSLRSIYTAHSDTGEYFIRKTIRGRTSIPTTFTPMELDETLGLDPLALSNREIRGESIAKVWGNADETVLEILSNTPNPVNINQIQIKGIFNEKYSSFNR